jgi:hypothetical protein
MKTKSVFTFLPIFQTAVMLFCLYISELSVNYLLLEFFGKTLNFWIALVVGLVVGLFTIPVAIVVWILKFAGIM